MFSLEPQRTNFDLHFPFFGIPARIHPGFWLVSFLLSFGASQQGTQPIPLLICMGVMFVSILVHELGHALLMRHYGFAPRIVLYHMGGLAIADQGFSMDVQQRRTRRDTWPQILICLAGPGAGFLLAAFVVALVFAGGGRVELDWSDLRDLPWSIHPGPNWPQAIYQLVFFALQINILWGVINLVPVFPLDGGQIARELLMYRDKYNGMTQTLQLSIGVGIVMAVFLWFALQDQFAAMMFALLAISNYITLQQMGRYS